MNKLLLSLTALLAIGASGCSNNSEEAPPPKGNQPNVSPPPPGMTGPGMRQAEPDGEGSR